jgi:hypothetical protein
MEFVEGRGALAEALQKSMWTADIRGQPTVQAIIELVHHRCWTTDRLHKRELLLTQKCTLCDQVQENIDHLLIWYPFAHEIWFKLCQANGLNRLVPATHDFLRNLWGTMCTIDVPIQSKGGGSSSKV